MLIIKKNKLIVSILLIILFLIEYFYIKDINTLFITGYNDEVNRAIVYDARFYYEFVSNFGKDTLVYLKLFGPLSISYIFDNNLLYIFFFYFTFFLLSIYSFVHYLKGKKILFFIFLLFYPVMVGSLYGANKEITSYISLLFMLTYIISSKKRYLLLAFSFAILSRFELVLVYIAYLIISRFQKKMRIISIIIMLFTISVILKVFHLTNLERLNSLITEKSTGLSLLFANMSDDGLYFLVFPFRAMMNMYSGIFAGFNLHYIVTIFLFISNIMFIVFTIMAIKKKNFFIENNVFLLMLIYLIIFSSGYLIHHRYVAPIYVLLLYMAFFKQKKNLNYKWKKRKI